MTDTRYLTKRRQGYYVEIEIPPSLRHAMGKKRLVKSLETRDLTLARARRWSVVAALKAQIEAARTAGPAPTLDEAALTIRQRYISRNPSENAEAVDEIGNALLTLEKQPDAIVHRFVALSEGRITPIGLYLDDWFKATQPVPRTESHHRRSVTALQAWLKKAGYSDAVEAVTREAASRFVVDHLIGERGLKRPTLINYRWGLTEYWRWMLDAGRIAAIGNPWEHQRIPKASTAAARNAEGSDEDERPFTDNEVARLLGGSPERRTRDAIFFGALTGARLEAIFRLRVRDCDLDGQMLSIPPLKKEKGSRPLPIHSDLLPVVIARCAGKGPEAWLFDDVDEPKTVGRERSMAESEAFGRYLRKLELEQMRPGRRRSLVNFHSFRRWFITKAEEAGYPESLIALAVGHSRKGMTFGVYSKPDMQKQLRALVGSIVLPEPIKPESAETARRRTGRKRSTQAQE